MPKGNGQNKLSRSLWSNMNLWKGEPQEQNFETTLLFFADHLPNNYLFAMTSSPPRRKLAAVENEMNNYSDHLVAMETGSNEICTFPIRQGNSSPTPSTPIRDSSQTHWSFHRTFGHTRQSKDDQEDSESGCPEHEGLHQSGNISQPVHY